MVEDEKFYESSDESDEEEEESDEEDSDENGHKKKKKSKKKPYSMDPDHRLLLRVSKPLLQSRNAAVSLCVSHIYWRGACKATGNGSLLPVSQLTLD